MSTGVAPREGRRIVTALFADVVGSTALGETLDPEDFMDIVGQAVGRIVVAVEGSGGSVHKLLGDGVLGLFGVPAANEDDAERAVQAGLRITADIAAYAREVTAEWALEGFDVRVGIETGLVVLGQVGAGRHHEYGVAGDAVNTAARLQAAADPGMVLVGQATQRLVAGAFAWAEPQPSSSRARAAISGPGRSPGPGPGGRRTAGRRPSSPRRPGWSTGTPSWRPSGPPRARCAPGTAGSS
jgi:class 3 adenylate cyclase